MSRKTRYFLVGSATALVLGIGGGMLAYYRLARTPLIGPGLPTELRFVPATADIVAYADVHGLMNSDVRRELERVAGERHLGQHTHEFAGVDITKDVDHVVAFVRAENGDVTPPRGLIVAKGQFDQARIEQFIRDHGGATEEYHGKRLFRPAKRDSGDPDMAMAFLASDEVAMGGADLVRGAIDTPASGSAASIAGNREMMDLMREAASGNAWVVGRFEAVQQRMHLPPSITGQVPPLRLVSASAHVNGGVKATIKAETADKAAADQLRDVVRGAIALARANAGSTPGFQDVLKSVELGVTGTNVQMSFLMTTDTLRALSPQKPEAPSK
jgi:hypothetical protein